MSARGVPPGVVDIQKRASDPSRSAFVAANAGSGKTYVLVQRVIRLLLEGADPEKILCLTFTKAAAANMARGVFDTLSSWTAFDDAALDEKLRSLDGGGASAPRRQRARRLFAQALETPGGLKVQTIHAFCTRLLHQFPFEARVAARFSVLEERAEEELIASLRQRVLMDAAEAPDSPLGRALSKTAEVAGDQAFADVLRAALAARAEIAQWIAHAGRLTAAANELAHALGIAPDDCEAEVNDAILTPSLLNAADLAEILATVERGSSNDTKLAQRMRRAAEAMGEEKVAAYLDVFFTQQWTPLKNLLTQKIAGPDPLLAERLRHECDRLIPLVERRHGVRVRDRSVALLTLAQAVSQRYRDEKNRRGLLDYDDLIEKALALLNSVDASWVHYKLDLGIDHVLIDEAQDTSPRQWEIVCRLVGEFTAGQGARTTKRTIFAVGDEKQSIFSFQGAVPSAFADMRRHFKTAHEAGGFDFLPCRFDFSFRSGVNVLGAVDTVFADPALSASITDDEGGAPRHEALPDAAPGVVDLWPMIAPDERRVVEGWDAPFDAQPETSPPVQLARRIASTIAAWLAQGERRQTGQTLRAGDILILVRQRGPLFNAVIRALKDAGIAVAGADRLELTDHIAVMDLLVLADALLSPHDELALATALKSPLFGLDEDELFSLAAGREGTLREALRARASEPAFAAHATRIAQMECEARLNSPFAFYSALLGPDGGRARMLARLGVEAADALDEFLALALAYETRESPTLQGFIAWMRRASAQIKRDMEIGRDEVRVMTAHGAKGLEAPVVIVADTTTQPAGPRQPLLLRVPAPNAAPGTPDRIVWPGKKDSDPAAVRQARAQAVRSAEDEYRRLLYVALTRAQERLIVCGARGEKAMPAGCWYELVSNALTQESEEAPAPYGEGTILRWQKMAAPALPPLPPPQAVPAERESRPAWLAPLPKRAGAAILTPSTAAPHVGRVRRGVTDARARQRGQLVHRLMQSLPELTPDRRDEAAIRYLARAGAAFTEDERQALAVDVLALLNEPGFARLFGPDSRAEVPIIGRLSSMGKEVRVSGQIDRLVITESHVLIVDYKTDRPAPSRLTDAPQSYLVQLALYRAVLTNLYPGRELRAALLWTNTAQLMEVPAADLDTALHHHGVRAA